MELQSPLCRIHQAIQQLPLCSQVHQRTVRLVAPPAVHLLANPAAHLVSTLVAHLVAPIAAHPAAFQGVIRLQWCGR